MLKFLKQITEWADDLFTSFEACVAWGYFIFLIPFCLFVIRIFYVPVIYFNWMGNTMVNPELLKGQDFIPTFWFWFTHPTIEYANYYASCTDFGKVIYLVLHLPLSIALYSFVYLAIAFTVWWLIWEYFIAPIYGNILNPILRHAFKGVFRDE